MSAEPLNRSNGCVSLHAAEPSTAPATSNQLAGSRWHAGSHRVREQIKSPLVQPACRGEMDHSDSRPACPLDGNLGGFGAEQDVVGREAQRFGDGRLYLYALPAQSLGGPPSTHPAASGRGNPLQRLSRESPRRPRPATAARSRTRTVREHARRAEGGPLDSRRSRRRPARKPRQFAGAPRIEGQREFHAAPRPSSTCFPESATALSMASTAGHSHRRRHTVRQLCAAAPAPRTRVRTHDTRARRPRRRRLDAHLQTGALLASEKRYMPGAPNFISRQPRRG